MAQINARYVYNGKDITNDEEMAAMQAKVFECNVAFKASKKLVKLAAANRRHKRNKVWINDVVGTAQLRQEIATCHIDIQVDEQDVPVKIRILWTASDQMKAVGWDANFKTNSFHALEVDNPEPNEKFVSRQNIGKLVNDIFHSSDKANQEK